MAPDDELQRTRRELEIAYDELQSTLKELEATSEALQSTNEALESTNEELETLSNELGATNAALETVTDELHERTQETLRINSVLDSVLSGIEQGVVVVDPTLRIVAWSARATDLWGLRDDEVEGENLLDLEIGIRVQQLRDPIRRVLAGSPLEQIELDGHDHRGKPAQVRFAFTPLRNRSVTEAPAGAILLISAAQGR